MAIYRFDQQIEIRNDRRQILLFSLAGICWTLLAFFFGMIAAHKDQNDTIEQKLATLGWLDQYTHHKKTNHSRSIHPHISVAHLDQIANTRTTQSPQKNAHIQAFAITPRTSHPQKRSPTQHHILNSIQTAEPVKVISPKIANTEQPKVPVSQSPPLNSQRETLHIKGSLSPIHRPKPQPRQRETLYIKGSLSSIHRPKPQPRQRETLHIKQPTSPIHKQTTRSRIKPNIKTSGVNKQPPTPDVPQRSLVKQLSEHSSIFKQTKPKPKYNSVPTAITHIDNALADARAFLQARRTHQSSSILPSGKITRPLCRAFVSTKRTRFIIKINHLSAGMNPYQLSKKLRHRGYFTFVRSAKQKRTSHLYLGRFASQTQAQTCLKYFRTREKISARIIAK